MGVVRTMETTGRSEGATSRKVSIIDCGELKEGEDDGVAAGGYPDYPEDLDAPLDHDGIVTAANNLKTAGLIIQSHDNDERK